MITKKLGIIGCGNMGGAILYGALESGVIAKEHVFVYDINPAMRKAGASKSNCLPACGTDLPWNCKNDPGNRHAPGTDQGYGDISCRNYH